MSRRPRVRRENLARAVGGALTTLVLMLILGTAWVVWTYGGPGPGADGSKATTVILPRGASVGQIARSLSRSGVIGSSRVFELAARFTGAGRSLKAGEYQFASHATMSAVLADIRDGKVVRHLVAVPEGFTSAMALDAVNAEPVLSGGASEPPEGSLLPDTYQVQRGEDRGAVIHKMRAARDVLLAQLWAGRAPGLPLNTPDQAVTLASIVEKETALPAERPRIAAVFENRLRAGIRLETDPTVIYGITRGRPLGRGITMRELVTMTPYNTYRIVGLPPTPIANPGRASLAAVLNPPRSTELFFVANGQGGHVFASTFEAHQQNVARWRAVERGQAAAASGARK